MSGLHKRLTARSDGLNDQHAGELAYHYLQAPPARDALIKATEYAVRAAVPASGQLAYEEAAVQYEHALRALHTSGWR